MGHARLVLLVLAALLACRLSPGDDNIPTIPVVHTWGDLLATHPIKLDALPLDAELKQKNPADAAPSFHVWIGIDRDHVAPHGAVLIYCLAQGIRFQEPAWKGVGPFTIALHRVDTKIARDAVQQQANRLSSPMPDYTLYAGMASVEEAGDYVVELQDPWSAHESTPPRIYARMKLKVAGPAALPWSPWAEDATTAQSPYPPGASQVPQPDPFAGAVTMAVCNPIGGIALPTAPKTGFPLLQLPDRNQPLPRLNLDEIVPGAEMKLINNSLLVTLTEALAVGYPSERFLTRWWINDQPFQPDPSKAQQMDRAEATLEKESAKFAFILDFRPERLGAKKGDKIGVQLLVCPQGWQFDGIAALVANLAQRPPPHAPTSLCYPTPRIDFIYSGDPKAVEQK